MRIHDFLNGIHRIVLDGLWKCWSDIGVRAAIRSDNRCVIDPEVLLLLSLEFGAVDPRLFDAVLEWLLENHGRINVVRLSNLHIADAVAQPNVLGAVASFLESRDGTTKWTSLAKSLRPSERDPVRALFGRREIVNGTLEKRSDPIFWNYRLQRPTVRARGLAAPVLDPQVPLTSAANLVFRARALFGVNTRADVFVELLLRNQRHNATRLAGDLAYSQRQIHNILTEFHAAQICEGRTGAHSKDLGFSKEVIDGWKSVLGITDCPRWQDWRALARCVTVLRRASWELWTKHAMEETARSRIREMGSRLDGDFQAAGLRRPSRHTMDGIYEGILSDLRPSFGSAARP